MLKKNDINKIYLAIDWGGKRIGLALADSETNLALPFLTVNNLTEVLKVIKEERVDQIILGNPLKMSNNDKIDKNFSLFLDNLKKNVSIPVILVDERLSTKAVYSLSLDKKIRADKDSLAACLLLQNYLERLSL
jgi:putative holliday junction resolvase